MHPLELKTAPPPPPTLGLPPLTVRRAEGGEGAGVERGLGHSREHITQKTGPIKGVYANTAGREILKQALAGEAGEEQDEAVAEQPEAAMASGATW